MSRGQALPDELSDIVELCALQCAALRMLILLAADHDDRVLIGLAAQLDQVEAAAREARRKVGLLMHRHIADDRR